MYDSVLVPTDGSKTVERTLDHALPIAVNNDATVHSLYVIDNRIVTAADREVQSELEASLREEGKAALEMVTDRATEAGLETTQAIRTGTPWKEIITYASAEAIDLIVIGTHGKSPKEKQVSLGSVSERVVDNAPVPVFVVRNPTSE